MVKLNTTTTMGTKTIQKVLSQEVSKTQKIITLFNGGIDIKSISEYMGIRYNFVYNVISNEVFKGTINEGDIIRDKKVSKKDLIIKLLGEGMSIKDICIQTKSTYNQVWGIKKGL